MVDKRDPRATRRLILDAAASAFGTHGPAGARIDAIAAEAGVNKRMLYHYFGDKAGLFAAVLEDRVQQGGVLPSAAALVAGDPAIATVDLRLMAWAAIAGRGPGAGYTEQWQRLLTELGAEQAAGRLRDDVEPRVLAVALLGAAAATSLLGEFAGAPANSGDSSRQQLAHLVHPAAISRSAPARRDRPRVRMQPDVRGGRGV